MLQFEELNDTLVRHQQLLDAKSKVREAFAKTLSQLPVYLYETSLQPCFEASYVSLMLQTVTGKGHTLKVAENAAATSAMLDLKKRSIFDVVICKHELASGRLQQVLQVLFRTPDLPIKHVIVPGNNGSKLFRCEYRHQATIIGSGDGPSHWDARELAAIPAMEWLKENWMETSLEYLRLAQAPPSKQYTALHARLADKPLECTHRDFTCYKSTLIMGGQIFRGCSRWRELAEQEAALNALTTHQTASVALPTNKPIEEIEYKAIKSLPLQQTASPSVVNITVQEVELKAASLQLSQPSQGTRSHLTAILLFLLTICKFLPLEQP